MKRAMLIPFLLTAALILMLPQIAFASGEDASAAPKQKISATSATTLEETTTPSTKTYTVTFQGYYVVTVKEGECVLRPPDPDFPEGTTFLGWFNVSGGEKFDFDTPITQDIVLAASITFQTPPYPPLTWVVVTFNSKGGTPVGAQSFTLEDRDTIVEPKDPVKVGYTFLGWYTEDGKKWNFSQGVGEDMTLYAHWAANPSRSSSSQSSSSQGDTNTLPPTSDSGVPFLSAILLSVSGTLGLLGLNRERRKQD